MRTSTRRALTGATLLAVALTLTLAGCGGSGEEQAKANNEVFPVETIVAERSSVSPVLSYAGTVLPERKALLGAQIQGPIERFHVDAGDEVRKGDLLVELASEQLTQAEAQYVAVEKDWERMNTLLEKGAVTQQMFDQVDAGYQAAKATYEMVLESARIRAPFDGVITERYFDEGEVFIMMPVATPTPAILELSSIDRVKVEVEVSERERMLARVGLPAIVTVDAHPGVTFRGKVERIDPALDRMSRTSTADVMVSNSRGLLLLGMFADVELTLAEKEGLLITRDAMIRQEGTGSFYAYVVEGGVAVRRNLTLGDAFGDRMEVLDGIEAGDVVVTAGRYKLHNGAAVSLPGTEGNARRATGDAATPGEPEIQDVSAGEVN